MTDTPIHPDSALVDLDIPAAISAGMTGGDSARQHMFTDAAIAAAIRLEHHGVGPYPVAFLARYVRAAGRATALALPQPLVGDAPEALARQWLTAAAGTDDDPLDDDRALDGDLTFARWLDMVAALLDVRRSTRASTGPANR